MPGIQKKIRPQDKWNEKNGLVSVSYKLTKSISDAFSDTCHKLGLSKKSQLEKMMLKFIDKHKEEAKNVKMVEIEVELPEWLDKKAEEAGINISEVLCEYLIEKYHLA